MTDYYSLLDIKSPETPPKIIKVEMTKGHTVLVVHEESR